MKKNHRSTLSAALMALTAAAPHASAVSLNPDGLGQALIFPYYTVQSSSGNPFNTYLSVVNHAADTKAIRVRVRESRNSREVASFNLFLAPNDAWTGAIVPPLFPAEAPRLITADRSCTSPTATADVEHPPGFAFQNAFFSGTFSDGNGEGLDRTREGWIEMIEMATLTGASATNVAFGAAGSPNNCAAMQGAASPTVAAPSGGISGTLTLINVASGFDFTVSAEALADLATRPFYRQPTDSYPDFNAAEIDPVSVVVANGFAYRSVWTRPADAVSATMMRSAWRAEYVLDQATASLSDIVVTLPTRQFYATAAGAVPPFTAASQWAPQCVAPGSGRFGESVFADVFDREERSSSCPIDPCVPTLGPRFNICGAVSVTSVRNGAPHMPSTNTAAGVLGSTGGGWSGLNTASLGLSIFATMQHGWLTMGPAADVRLSSLSASTRLNLSTGQLTAGSHQFGGLPMLGAWVRVFQNGTLSCSAGSCQGNYGGAFPMHYQRTITP